MTIQDTIWQVSALNFEIKTMLEQGVGTIWIEGEVSNFSQPASGHWYFSLKDERAQLRAAMFRNRNQRASFTPQNGQKILVRAQVTLYEARGEFQVIVEHLEEAGIGRLMRQFEALKRQLAGEDLFDARHKKPIPRPARHIGIVTSATGAAIRDALSVIRRRSPSTQVTVFATPVQGEQAVEPIVQALSLANRHAQCDVLLLIRGGGSLEDLWCFNEEAVARAIFASEIPVVSGVGHEIDTTIADLVADLRAPTPSVAAESVTLDQYEQMARVDELAGRLQRALQTLNIAMHANLAQLQTRLMNLHPERQLSGLQQRLAHAQISLLRLQQHRLQMQSGRMQLLSRRLHMRTPATYIENQAHQLEKLRHGLISRVKAAMLAQRHALALTSSQLDQLSPLKTLARGYAVVSRDNELIKQAADLSAGDQIAVRFIDAPVKARVL